MPDRYYRDKAFRDREIAACRAEAIDFAVSNIAPDERVTFMISYYHCPPMEDVNGSPPFHQFGWVVEVEPVEIRHVVEYDYSPRSLAVSPSVWERFNRWVKRRTAYDPHA